MSLLYLLAGINHFYNPDFYIKIIPASFTAPEFMVAISGFIEIILAVLVLINGTRKIGSWLIVGMLVVFFFLIHIPMAIDYYHSGNPMLWLALVRLPVQALLIWWALKVSRIRRYSPNFRKA